MCLKCRLILVAPSGLGHRQDQRAAVHARRATSDEARDRRDARTVDALGDRVVYRSGRRRRAAHEREVALVHPPRLESLGEDRRRLPRPREDQRAAGPPVQSVDGVDVRADRVADAKHRHVVIVAPPAMNEQARGLVRHDHVGIDEQELHGREGTPGQRMRAATAMLPPSRRTSRRGR